MATFTDLLRLVLQDTGENDNVWGGVLNASMIQLLDQAIAGTVDVDVTAGDVTLTTANGATDQARFAVVKASGNPGTAREVIVPTLSKIYCVINNTNPVEDVEFKTASNAGVVVSEQATPVLVYVDQANLEVVAINAANALEASNALSLGGFPAADYARLALSNLFTAGQSTEEVVIASGATPTPDLALSNSFSFRPSVGFTVQRASNPLSGQAFNLLIEIAGGTGGGFVADYKFPGGVSPVIPGNAGDKWLISCYYDAVDDVFVCGTLEDVA